MNSQLREVLSRLNNVSEKGAGQWTALCPAHDDANPSLSIAEGDRQPVVFKCHANCSSESIVDALGMDWTSVCDADSEAKDEFYSKPWEHGEHVATYSYHNASGEHVYDVKRYEHPERDWKTFRPYLPGNFRAGLGKTRRVLYRLREAMEAAADERVVFVVEGEKDVETLRDAGFTATTSGASSSWTDRYAERLAGARVVVIPDNDDAGREFALDVARSCYDSASFVRILELEDVPEDGGDVTDWFNRGHTDDELAEAVKNTDNWTPRETAGGAPHGDGQAHPEPTLAADATDGWKAVQALYEDGKSKQARHQAAQLAIDEQHFATHAKSERLYAYDPENKVYGDRGEQTLATMLVNNLGYHHSQHEQNEIAGKIRPLTYREQFGGACIPVANGDLHLDPLRLEDATPDRAPLHRSPASWRPEATCPKFKHHLSELVPTQAERDTLQEYAGYCLLHWDLPFHKALFVVGPTASGKSTTLAVLQKMLGSVTSLSPQQLVNGRFGPAELEGAWANVRSDISAALLKDIGLFKELTAGDPIYAERKYEQGYTFRPTAKHIYSANQLPEVSIDDDAFYRRILIVSFPTTIPKDQRVNRATVDAQLEEEMDGILRWAVEGLQRLRSNGGFTHDLGPDDTRRRWEEHGSSIGRFKATALRVTGDGEDISPKQDVYRAYTSFCESCGLSTESQRGLTRALKRDPRIRDGRRTPEPGGKQTRCYVGFTLTEEWAPSA